MTATFPSTTTPTPRRPQGGEGTSSGRARSAPPRGGLAVCWHYLVQTVRLTLTDVSFVGFLLAMPTAMYLFFAQLYKDEPGNGPIIQQSIMVMMATYGAMGSAMFAGNSIQGERSTGWFRQLMLSSLTPARFFAVRLLAALALIVPPVVLVLAVGYLDGVRLGSIWVWLRVVGVSLVVLVPFVLLGIVIALWLKTQTASAATTFTMLAMAMLGGMWVPLDQMPGLLQSVGRLLPSYWAANYALLPISGGEIQMRGVWTLVGWTIGLIALGVVGYRRAVANSKR